MDCSICKVVKDEKFVCCDSCNTSFHANCVGISGREQQCLDMKKRTMSFYCTDCKNSLLLLPKFLKLVEKLNEKFESISEKLEKLSYERRDENEGQNFEKVIEELNERKFRETNVIVFNIEESTAKNTDERINHDKAKIKAIIDPILPSAEFKAIRIGNRKTVERYPRPVKVIFNTSSDATVILKNKFRLAPNNVKIKADLTVLQREKLKATYAELASRKAAGEENLIVKIVNGTPKIVVYNMRQKNGTKGTPYTTRISEA